MPSLRQLFLAHVAQTSETPLMLEIEKAEGIYLFDTSGKKYIDLISGISVSNLGHCHPEVLKAIQQQSQKYLHLMVYGEFIQSPQVQLAKLLTDNMPSRLESVYFVNSGSEATEGAMKLAKKFTGRNEIIYFEKAYHGSTQGALSIMGDECFKNSFRPLLPDTKMLRFNVKEDLKQITEDTACVIIETVQGESGVTIPDKNYMIALRNRCDETGSLLILDEIQTGLGRTGSLFAFSQFDIEPDILLLAKGLGAGMPLGAFIASKRIMSSFKDNPVLGHITTFGGHPVCCAAGLAGLKTLLNLQLINSVRKKEKLFRELLIHPAIKEVRSFGLLMAVEFKSYEINKKVIDNCVEKGVVVDWFLFADNCLRIAPPLIITEDQIREACEVIIRSI